jgi:RHS repeat-associated protein
LGGIRVGSTSSRTVQFDLAYAPFGDTYATSGSADPAFTSQRQDTVAGLFDFPAREYSNEGRWTSPDPSGLASAHLSDPQTLNRYAYVRNNPLALTDPQGLDCTYGGSYENGAVGEYAADSGVSDDCPNDGPPLNTLLSDSSGNLNFYVADDDMIRNL